MKTWRPYSVHHWPAIDSHAVMAARNRIFQLRCCCTRHALEGLDIPRDKTMHESCVQITDTLSVGWDSTGVVFFDACVLPSTLSWHFHCSKKGKKLMGCPVSLRPFETPSRYLFLSMTCSTLWTDTSQRFLLLSFMCACFSAPP